VSSATALVIANLAATAVMMVVVATAAQLPPSG
jgi:hypothetical protein